MPLHLSTSPLYGTLFGDGALAACLDEAREITEMVRVEAALARVQGRLGLIPQGEALAAALDALTVPPDALAAGTAADGVPVPALIASLRSVLPAQLAEGLHWGATSQDIVDTAHVLQYRACLDDLIPRLAALIDRLADESRAHAATLMAGRTRSQIAAPTTFGLRVATWAQPLISVEADIPRLRERLLRVQFGGAVGSNAATAPHGQAIAAGLATELDLAVAPPWHNDRSGPLALGAWLTALTAGLSRLAGDVILLGRSEIAEARAGSGGASSTMPQKSNPVAAEAVRALAHLCQAQTAGLARAASPAEDRDGTAWALEWALLPQALLAAGAALRHAEALIDSLVVNPEAMLARLRDTDGVMAETASFVLAAHMPRTEAKSLVRDALASEAPLVEALGRLGPEGLDWADLLDPVHLAQPATETAKTIFATRVAP